MNSSLPGEESKKEFTAVLHRAVDLLSRREHSAKELSEKLQRKGFAVEIVGKVVEKLIADRLQSDDRFTESFVNERKRRGHGPIKIQHELSHKGVSSMLIEAYVDVQSHEWFELAQLQYQKKYANTGVNNYNEWTKRARFLQSRGFTTPQIRASVIFSNEVD